jgi:NAD(P)H-dependent flavin oxidoreductase YrpB (nitropropane dioxygenase family)
VAQGVEAGGHVRGTTPLDQLIREVHQVASGIPVLAAGGIATVEDVLRAIGNGADGIWAGTRFVASEESRAHPDYKKRLLAARAGDTELGTTFDVGWPGAPHRAICNSTMRECGGGRRPGEGQIIARYADGRPILRYDDTIPLEGMTGDLEALALYAGTSVEGISDVLPAATIVARLSTAFTS